jgi:hypothetical protein
LHPSDLELDALARGAGAPEVVAHVRACLQCGPALRQRRAVLGLLAELPEVEPSELEWKRIDRHVLEALDREQAARSGRRSAWVLAVPAVAAAAACAVVGLKLASLSRAPATVAVVAPAQPAVALALGGDAHTGRGGPEILEGDALDAARGSIEVQTAPATGVALLPGTRVRASRLRVGQTEFTLESGRLLAEVKPLKPGASFAVRAGDLTVHVVGTAFEVERSEGRVRVAVVHGRVRVDRAGQAGELFVPGGSQAEIPDGAALAEVTLAPLPGDLTSQFPLSFPELAPDDVERQFGQAEIESEPAGAQARLDGAARGVTPLTVLAAEGTHQVELNLPGHKPQQHSLRVSRTRAQTTLALPAAVPVERLEPVAPVPTPAPTPAPVAAPKKASKAAAAPPAPAPQVSYAEAFHTAALTHQAEVQACYAKLNGDFARRLHLVLSIQATGQVAPPVQVEEPGVDPAFVDCVTGAARAWSFPPPGRSYEVSIPYDLAPGR